MTLRTLYHVTPAGNLDAILRDGLVPGIGPRSQALNEHEPAIYTFSSLMDLDGAGWLGEVFDEDERLVVLAVQVGPSVRCREGAGYEVVLADAVPAPSLKVLCRDLDDPVAYQTLMQEVVWDDPWTGTAPASDPSSDRSTDPVPAPTMRRP